MNVDHMKTYRNILCIDLKSFYASCECALRGLDPFKTPLVVADRSRGGGSVVLAVTPYLKAQGVSSRCRVFELPNDKNIIYARPQMKKYLEVSAQIVNIYLDYVSEEDMHIYSIDEVFLDVTDYLKCHKMNEYEIAITILNDILKQTKIPATCGIGPNMLIAKLALDIESKKAPSFVAQWDYDDLKTKLWPITPLSKMWGIGSRMERNLNALGLMKVGDIAEYDVNKLIDQFGILGEELYLHVHGIDASIMSEDEVISKSKSYGISQVLFKDYNAQNVKLVIREMVDEVSRRLRVANKKGHVIHFGVGYSKATGGGFYRQLSLSTPTDFADDLYKNCLILFEKFYSGEPIRKISISVSNLVSANHHYQLNLFEDDDQKERRHELDKTVDTIKYRYGKNAVLRASSYLEDATQRFRNTLIGGHNSE